MKLPKMLYRRLMTALLFQLETGINQLADNCHITISPSKPLFHQYIISLYPTYAQNPCELRPPFSSLSYRPADSIIQADDSIDLKDLTMRPALICLLGIIMLMTAAVSAQDAEPTTGSEPAIASVNGVIISQAAFERTLARITSDTNVAAADSDALEIEVLGSLIEQELIAQFAAQNDIAASTEEVDAEIMRLQDNLRETAWDDWLAGNFYTAEGFRAAIHDQILTSRVRDLVTAELHGMVEHVHARHILVASLTAARAILASLENGADFAALAAEASLDVTSRGAGGDLGWFARGELLEDVLSETAFATETGAITGPVTTNLGYHILETLGREHRAVDAARLPALVKSLFRRWLEEQLQAARVIYNL